jgi:DNA ligase 1
MRGFAQTAESIAATRRKLAKIALLGDYFRAIPVEDAAVAAVFFSGSPFAAHEEATLQVGGALLWRVIAEISGKSEAQLSEIYRRVGDAGAVAAEALSHEPENELTLLEVERSFRDIAMARGPSAKSELVRGLLGRAGPLEAKYIVKIISGDLRIGLKESLVEEAIARAFDAKVGEVQRANMLLGDIGETLRLASQGKLGEARLRLFHPIDFMLASPVDSAEEALSYFTNATVEDKYDGIRAQAHVSEGEVRLFSRTRDEITESFPELVPELAGLPVDAILDGEILAWTREGGTNAMGRALPFSRLQQRLGRKKVSEKLMREVPVAYLVFDVLYAEGELLLERPLGERAQILSELMERPRKKVVPAGRGQSSFEFGESGDESRASLRRASLLRAPVSVAHSPEDLEGLFAAARARGNEGLMIKDLDSLYTPGRRGKSWLKMKRELATLDVVVTAVEYGHGKRIGVLSDYTFAVWDGDRLVNVGKAYSGLTDAEIAEMTEWFLAHKVSEQGLWLEVEPKIVLEVAFNNMMRSTRHESGYALRFPRIVRLRPDKLPEQADTIETVKEIYEREHGV